MDSSRVYHGLRFNSPGDIRLLPADIGGNVGQGSQSQFLFYGNSVWHCHCKNSGHG